MILLKNGTYIDWVTLEFTKADIQVEDGPDGKIILDPDPSLIESKTAIDCSNMLIMKSLGCGHHHVYSALARGMPAPRKNPVNFNEILQYIWWNLDKALDPEMIRYSAFATAIACAKNGVTFVIDHHASPQAIPGCLSIIAEAFDEVGIGHLLCYEITDRDGFHGARQGLDETADYLSNHQGLVGLHASFTVGDETLMQAVRMAEESNSGLHVHVAEALSDQEHCLNTCGLRVIERFAEAGVLKFPKTILVHCLHLNDHERGLIAGSPAWVVQNTESNLNNSVGHFNSAGLGDRIMLGTDGMHSDMFRSAKAAFFSGHNYDTIDYSSTYQRLRNVHRYLENNKFKGDGDNNLIIMNYDSPTPIDSSNFLGHFLFGFENRHIHHVISQGKLIMKDQVITTIDEHEILKESNRLATRLWDRLT